MAALPKHEPGTPEWALEKCLTAMRRDRDDLERYDAYLAGDHDPVYIPDETDAEFQLLAQRAVLNLMPLVINSVTQVCYVESIRHGDGGGEDGETLAEIPPEMESWQYNRMNARQLPLVRTLAAHGAVYTVVRKDERTGRARLEAYSGLRATAIFNDPANDLDPIWGLVIKDGNQTAIELGYLYSETHVYEVSQTKSGRYNISTGRPHGNSSCPVSRIALGLDLEGNATGMIETLIEPQNQVNQSSFDVLALQSYNSFATRYISGMSTPIRRWSQVEIDNSWPKPTPDDPDYEAKYNEWLATDKPSAGDPVLDSNGQEIPLPLRVNHKRIVVADDKDTKVGQLDATDVRPLLAGLADRVKYFFSISQTPASYGVGEMANLSAEALNAAEIAKTRRDDYIKMVLAEGYERNFNLAMELEGYSSRAADESMEIVWRDTDPHSIGMIADAYGKMAEMLDVPVTVLWEDLPNMTPAKLKHWLEAREKEREESPELEMVNRIDQHDALSLADPEEGLPSER